jgi:signal peptidase I
MNDTLVAGDRVFAIPFPDQVLFGERHPARGDVVVFRFPKDRSVLFLQRIVGLPGETCEIRRGTVLVNGMPLDEPYVRPGGEPENWGPRRVPAGSYFVLGDHRNASNDSRNWGVVPQEDVVGRVAVILWPSGGGWSRFGRRLDAPVGHEPMPQTKRMRESV